MGVKSLQNLKDVSPGALLEEMADKVQQLARQMLVPIGELERFSGGYIWRHPTRDIQLSEVRGLMEEIAFFAARQEPDFGPRRGQPPVPWKHAGQQFSLAVKAAMQAMGYKGRLGLADPESIPVIVAAGAISWAYGKPVSPSGFVTAMRNRDRAKTKKPNASVLNRWNKDNPKT